MRVEVIADFHEEGWPSMDLAADMLQSAANGLPGVECVLMRPKLWRPSRTATTPRAYERALGRFVQYPVRLMSVPRRAAYYHIADHSYAHLAHCLPRQRTGIYCHDLDAFRDAFGAVRRPLARRALSRLLIRGLRRAAVIFYSTQVVREALLAERLVDARRLVHAPFGIAPEFGLRPTALDAEVRAKIGARYVLNVGSCIARKNVPFLLRIFAELRRAYPDLRLVQVGGTWSDEQRRALHELGIEAGVIQVSGLSRSELAAYYRQACVVLLPTKAEGFGLPVTEALACGATVLASHLPVLVEVGGEAAYFAATDELADWVAQARAMLDGVVHANLSICQKQTARYSWERHARIVIDAYRNLGAARGMA